MPTNKRHWIWILVGLCLGLWAIKEGAELVARQQLEESLSLTVGSNTTIDKLNFGAYQTQVHQVSVLQEQSIEIPESIAIRNIVVHYRPQFVIQRPIVLDDVLITGLTVHWDGLTGNNIQRIVQSIEEHTAHPKRQRFRKNQPKEPNAVTVGMIEVEDIEIVLHIAGFSKGIQIPKLILKDITGNRESIAVQILKQLEHHIKEH